MRIINIATSNKVTEYETVWRFEDEDGDREVFLMLTISIEHFSGDYVTPGTFDISYNASLAEVYEGEDCKRRRMTPTELRDFCGEHDQDILDRVRDTDNLDDDELF